MQLLYHREEEPRGPDLPDEPARLYEEIRWPAAPAGRPYVAVNMVATVDGKATLEQGRHPKPVGSRVDRALMVHLRTRVDAILRGAGTIRQSPYHPSLAPRAAAIRRAEGRAEAPLVVGISRTGRLPEETPFFREGPQRPVIFLGPRPDGQAAARLEAVANVHVSPETDQAGSVDIPWMLTVLAERYGVGVLLSEGGPTLNHVFFRERVVDELFLTVAPFVAGGQGERTIVEGGPLIEPFARLSLLSAAMHEDELYLRYRCSFSA